MGVLSKHYHRDSTTGFRRFYSRLKHGVPRSALPRLIVALLIVASVPLGVFLSLRPASLNSRADDVPVQVYFSPATQSLPPNSVFRVMFNSGVNNVGFVSLLMTFDSSKVRLTTEITTSRLNTIIRKTDMATANSSGRAEIVLGLTPGEAAPTGVFQLAEFSLSAISNVQNDPVTLAIDSNDVQIVDTLANTLLVSVSPATLTLNPFTATATITTRPQPSDTPRPPANPTLTPTTRPIATITRRPTMTPTPRPTSTPTPRPTSTPTPRPTSTPTPRVSTATPTRVPVSTFTPTPRIVAPAPTTKPAPYCSVWQWIQNRKRCVCKFTWRGIRCIVP